MQKLQRAAVQFIEVLNIGAADHIEPHARELLYRIDAVALDFREPAFNPIGRLN